MSIKLWFRKYLLKNGLIIDKELIELLYDKITRPEDKEIEIELPIN